MAPTRGIDARQKRSTTVTSAATHAPPWAKVFKFAALPVISIASALTIIPVIAHSLGAAAWAAVALGQALGVTASVVINFGWSVVGPNSVARTLSPERLDMLSDSIWLRGILCLPAWIAVIPLALFLAPAQYGPLTAGMAIAVSTFGLTNSWYFIGVGQPGKIALFDTVPKVIVAAASIYPIIAWGNAYIYPILLFSATILCVIFSFKSASGHWFLGRMPNLVEIRKIIRAQGPLTTSTLVASGYTSFSIPLTSAATGPAIIAVAQFAGAQRLMNAGQSGIMAVISAHQGWISEKNPAVVQRKRTSTALVTTSLLGLIGGLALAVGLPAVDVLIFGPEVAISRVTATLTGAAFFAYSATASITLYVLVPLGKLRIVSIATILASIAGVPLLYILAKEHGTDGAAMAVAAAEFLVLAIELLYCLHLNRTTIRKRASREAREAPLNETTAVGERV